MTSILICIFIPVAARFCLPTQAGINAQLNIWIRSPVLARAISFVIGTISLVIYAFALGIP